MKSPKDMRIIQIDITNACVHECSNCTRFCGHHRKPFFMSFEMFKRSVDSLDGFNRCIGVMGGEPTIHPQFERFVEYLAEKYPSAHDIKSTRKPIKEFARYIHDKNYLLDECLNERKGPGLWTSVCNQYYKYYELIQDTFSFQNINDHQNPSLHQPLLISRKELGIDDEEWITLRDNCWIQNQWSATITPKGAFFCEVAGALDMLFDGPGGWKVEPGWWKREPKDFKEQLNWCEICGGALFNSGRLSSEEIDDVSPMLYEKLKQVRSPKIKTDRIVIMNENKKEMGTAMPDTINRYLLEHEDRVSKYNKSIYPKSIETITIDSENTTSFGAIISKMIYDETKDWICVNDGKELELMKIEKLIERLKDVVLNPGVLYQFDDVENMILFNRNASALKKAGFDGVAYCMSKDEFIYLWKEDKIIRLEDGFDADQNPDIDSWIEYAKHVKLQDKTKLHKCLTKIKSDYENKD